MEVLLEELPRQRWELGRGADAVWVLWGAEEGTSQDGEQEPGHPELLPCPAHPMAVIKGDTGSLSKDLQHPLNL